MTCSFPPVDSSFTSGTCNVFNLLAPRFGDLAVRENREKMLEAWFGSRLFRVSGLERAQVESKILDDCRNAGDFLCTVMGDGPATGHPEMGRKCS